MWRRERKGRCVKDRSPKKENGKVYSVHHSFDTLSQNPAQYTKINDIVDNIH